mmetsp:Transcript_10975/g.21492  ORF Transcript_10975/g.21492 Transcript_10975/m.21492 type:complete len:192 (-) Transcript_10975:1328-1903(-)|eukprot:CAMPEP_0204900784 /NCGR_PEP_ID=MMETSP1397-20131031/2672_1 /ASSEMBLY_ACC=CAM_ASM_000891 /TAXON_ID=49980 /ORGANISM="Climacostomum Climacostomum virens, Strain Stock W-24" /LENGTH=191 /DNA_ID=CAMNT_0052068997 /DNA_START=423 /DNA_END=998 /DNA_ORIENTATION=+
MDTLFGFVGKDFVILGCDRAARFSIVRLKDDEDKITALDGNKLLAAAGEVYDRVALTEVVQRNMHLYYYRNSVPLTTHATAHYIRNTLAESLRSSPYQANLILAGVDEAGPSLYYIDYLGTLQKLSKAAQGYASHFLYGLMDNYWRQDLSIEEGMELVKRCVHEMRTRFLVSQNTFLIKQVTSTGITVIEV